MSTCKRCNSFESLFMTSCGCTFCSGCSIECHTDGDPLCQEHASPPNLTENGKRRREMNDHGYCRKRGEHYLKDCACAANSYPCKYYYLGCTFKGSPLEIDKHHSDVDAHLDLSTRRQQNESTEIQLEEMKEMFENHCSQAEKKLTNKLMNKLEGILDAELSKQKQQLEKMKRKFTTDLTNVNANTQDLQVKLSGKYEFPNVKHSYTFVWKIAEFSKVQAKCKECKNVASVSSAPFYTAPFGYKMCLDMYPNGEREGKGTHLGLYLNIMKGEWDGILKWPVTYMGTLTLLAQYNRHDHSSYTLTSDVNQKDTFDRPVINGKRGWGVQKFFLLNDLKPLYLVDDCLYVKLDINIF